MNIIDILGDASRQKGFSIEVLPPLKGNGTETLFRNLDKVMDFGPNYINITTHHSEYVYRETADGQYERLRIRRRPGTIAVAAAPRWCRTSSARVPRRRTLNTSSSTCSFSA